MAKDVQLTIEKQIQGGTDADWVEICRCDCVDNLAAIVKAIMSSSKPPDAIRIRQVPVGL